MSKLIEANDSTFATEVVEASKQNPVLVDFSATWCGPCKQLEPVIEDLADHYAGRVKVVKVDIDGARDTASRLGVMSIPTLMLFVNEEVKDRVQPPMTKQSLEQRIDAVL